MVWNLPSKSCCLAFEPQGSARVHLLELGLRVCATNVLALLCEFWGITPHPLTCVPGLRGQDLKFSSSGVAGNISSLQLLVAQPNIHCFGVLLAPGMRISGQLGRGSELYISRGE